jgi:uncharacterized membrane protein
MDKLMKPNLRSLSAWVMLLAGISGFLASFILTIDKFKVLKDSGFTPSCSINETLNCKSVTKLRSLDFRTHSLELQLLP